MTITPEPWNGIYTQPNGLYEYLPQGKRQNGIHGYDHWERVVQNGLTLARCNGADRLVVSLFGWLHDACRENDNDDFEHGKRAAQLAVQLQGRVFDLDDMQLGELLYALELHDKGFTDRNITIGTCWDADRLDLPRVGVLPDTLLMSTQAGKMLAVEVRHRYSQPSI